MLALGGLACGVLLIEGGMRLTLAIRYHFFPPDRTRSEYFGWVTDADRHFSQQIPGYGLVHYSTVRHGFRRWENSPGPRHKIFVIGDSYTQAATVSDGETYYDRLVQGAPKPAVFAYGCGGYGSLQEFMTLDRYLDAIHPDLILWQFCANDLIENDVQLEGKSYYNLHQRRPYLEDGRIVWKVPTSDIGLLYNIVQASYLLRLCNIQVDAFKAHRRHWLEKDFLQEGALCARSAATTRQIMAMVRRRAGGVPIVAFSTTEAPWTGDTYPQICQKVKIDYLPGVARAVEEQKARGVAVDGRALDSHWNAAGHAIAGRLILEHLRRSYLTLLQ